MSESRRTFLRRTLAIGPIAATCWIDLEAQNPECTLPPPGKPTRFIPKEPTVLTRFSANEMADPKRKGLLDNFRAGIGALQKLPATDVRSWTKQVAQHCIECDPTNTRNIHYDQQFLPWHRGLLYFLERYMRILTKHDDLRLVYWDWESKASRTLPVIYAPPGQPLYYKNRGLTGPEWPLSDADTDVQPLLSVQQFSVFGGTATQNRPRPAAFTGPHALVHNAFDPGDMADLQYSPRDPVFYAHHSNIDRMWSSWVAAGHSNPDFGDARVLFYDENQTLRFVLMNDLKDERQLGYQYSSLMKHAVPAGKLTAIPVTGSGATMTVAAASLDRIMSRKSEPHFMQLLNIQDLDKMPATVRRYGVFDGPVPVGTLARDNPAFLGKISRVTSKDHAHTGPLSAVLNVSGRIAAALADKVLDLRVAPMDASGRTTGEAVPLNAEDVSIIG